MLSLDLVFTANGFRTQQPPSRASERLAHAPSEFQTILCPVFKYTRHRWGDSWFLIVHLSFMAPILHEKQGPRQRGWEMDGSDPLSTYSPKC